MQPNDVTEADRKLAAEVIRDAQGAIGSTVTVSYSWLVQGIAALLSSQREEHCRAVCLHCRAGITLVGGEHFAFDRYTACAAAPIRRHSFSHAEYCDAVCEVCHGEGDRCSCDCHKRPIRSLSLPEPPTCLCLSGGHDAHVVGCPAAPPKPEPR